MQHIISKLSATPCLVALLVATSAPAESLDPKREWLGGLAGKSRRETHTQYLSPQLVCQSGVWSAKSVERLAKDVEAYLRRGALSIAGHFTPGRKPSTELTPKDVPIPKDVVTGKQLRGIEDCSAKYCLHKLNIKKEKTAMGAASEKKKVETYHRLVLDRIERWLEKQELWGYEDVLDNRPAYENIARILSFLPVHYPKSHAFLAKEIWSGKRPAVPVTSFLRQEVAQLNREQLQPIWRIGEVFRFEEGGRVLFYEIHVYTNHFFDSSVRVYEVFPFAKGRTALVFTDVMEIDTLKLSSVARFLYRGQMEDAIKEYQYNELKDLW